MIRLPDVPSQSDESAEARLQILTDKIRVHMLKQTSKEDTHQLVSDFFDEYDVMIQTVIMLAQIEAYDATDRTLNKQQFLNRCYQVVTTFALALAIFLLIQLSRS